MRPHSSEQWGDPYRSAQRALLAQDWEHAVIRAPDDYADLESFGGPVAGACRASRPGEWPDVAIQQASMPVGLLARCTELRCLLGAGGVLRHDGARCLKL